MELIFWWHHYKMLGLYNGYFFVYTIPTYFDSDQLNRIFALTLKQANFNVVDSNL